MGFDGEGMSQTSRTHSAAWTQTNAGQYTHHTHAYTRTHVKHAQGDTTVSAHATHGCNRPDRRAEDGDHRFAQVVPKRHKKCLGHRRPCKTGHLRRGGGSQAQWQKR
uniref:Uncharacterized protein n=1 Tax=Eutreptiella gymnastica TaxID=73025 RepID=A0A6T2CEZ1_9EUGL